MADGKDGERWTDQTVFTKANTINCTPHALHIFVGDKHVETLERTRWVVRLSSTRKQETVGYFASEGGTVPVLSAPRYNVLEGTPPDERAAIVVSMAAAQHMATRDVWEGPVLAPGEPVRNEKGEVVGCRGLVRYR